MPFWLGQVLDMHKNDDGITVRVRIRWYEVYDRKDAWTGKYAPSTIQYSKKPWVSSIPVDSAFADFPSLKQKRIGSAAEKEIIAGLSSLGRSVLRSS